MRNFLLKLLEWITRHPRYHPEDFELDKKLHWSNKIWISNIFRGYEYLFGRGFGIRAELRSEVRKENDKLIIRYEFYTLEALLVHIEIILRGYLALFPSFIFYPQPQINYRPVYITFGLLGFFLSFHTSTKFLPLFGLAIALDVADTGSAIATSPLTWSHVCTGSNLFLAIGAGVWAGSAPSNPWITAVSYNSISATSAREDQGSGSITGACASAIWFLGNPASGSNTVSVSFNTAIDCASGAISYTGAQQTSGADAVNGINGINAAAQSFNVTTIADNCWVVGTGIQHGTTPTLTSPTQTSRWNIADGSAGVTAGQDTNAAKHPAGVVPIGWTTGGGSIICWSITGASFAPAGIAVPTYFDHTINQPNFPLVDINQYLVKPVDPGTYFRRPNNPAIPLINVGGNAPQPIIQNNIRIF